MSSYLFRSHFSNQRYAHFTVLTRLGPNGVSGAHSPQINHFLFHFTWKVLYFYWRFSRALIFKFPMTRSEVIYKNVMILWCFFVYFNFWPIFFSNFGAINIWGKASKSLWKNSIITNFQNWISQECLVRFSKANPFWKSERLLFQMKS